MMLVISSLVYRFIEEPARRRLHPRKPVATVALESPTSSPATAEDVPANP
jgi:peptidoglycan/LPS O-acetylase OafA/YrhL